MSAECVAESRILGSALNDLMNDSVAQASAGLGYQHEPVTLANDFVPQAPVDMAYSAESCEPAGVVNDPPPDLQGRPWNEFCEFQYIEIVPIGSPKQAENNNDTGCNEVKDEVKEEPEDVRIIVIFSFYL